MKSLSQLARLESKDFCLWRYFIDENISTIDYNVNIPAPFLIQ